MRTKKPFNRHTNKHTDPYHADNPNRYYHGAEIMGAGWVIFFAIGSIILIIGWIFDILLIMEIGGWIVFGGIVLACFLGYLLGRFAGDPPPIKIIRKW